jgi:CheY-like chemotaxis protein
MSASRILVVEDDTRLAATLQRVLATEGYDIEGAGDGLALERYRNAQRSSLQRGVGVIGRHVAPAEVSQGEPIARSFCS